MAGALLSTRGWRHDAGIEPRERVVRAVVGPDLSDRQSTIGALPAIDVVDAVNRRRLSDDRLAQLLKWVRLIEDLWPSVGSVLRMR